MATAEAQRQYQREWVARRKAEFFSGKACERCGSTELLRIDHVDPKQKVSHRIWTWSKKRREAELAKCQVLCDPCHHDKTCEDNGWNRHGTKTMYNRGCHCPDCTRANTEAQQNKRKGRVA